MIDDLYFGGDEYRLRVFGSHFDATKFRHSIVTIFKEDRMLGKQYGSMRDHYHQSGIQLLSLGLPAAPLAERVQKSAVKGILSAREKVQKLVALIQKHDVDVLDVHLSPANPVCALAAMKTRVPFVVTLYQVNQMRSTKLWLSGQFNLGAASQLLTDSEAQAKCLRQWLVRRRPIAVIPNGTAPPRATLGRDKMLRFFDIADCGKTIIGQVSSLVPYKGQMFVLDAAKRVLDRNPNCIFLLVGYERTEEGYKDLLQQRANELGISESVRIVGYSGAIGDVWSIIDIHVHGSVLDSLPNALLEAMSLGKPSVITRVGGIPEVIQHGSNGLLVPPGDSEQLAEKLLILLRHSELRAMIGSTAQACYRENFGPDRMARRLEAIFSNLVTGPKPRLPVSDGCRQITGQ